MPKICMSMNNAIKPGLVTREEVLAAIPGVDAARPIFNVVTGELIAIEVSGNVTDAALATIQANSGIGKAVFVPDPRILTDLIGMSKGTSAAASFFVTLVAAEHQAIVDYRVLADPKTSLNAGVFSSGVAAPSYVKTKGNLIGADGSTITCVNKSLDEKTRAVFQWAGETGGVPNDITHISGTLPSVGDFVGLETDPLAVLPRDQEFEVTAVVGSVVSIKNDEDGVVPFVAAGDSVVNPRGGLPLVIEGGVDKNFDLDDSILGKFVGADVLFGKELKANITLPPAFTIDAQGPPNNQTQAIFWMAIDPSFPSRISLVGGTIVEVTGPGAFTQLLAFEEAVSLNYVAPVTA